ncbi:MAG: N-acetyltransferase family protein [Hyphomicrobiaceae bacterium]
MLGSSSHIVVRSGKPTDGGKLSEIFRESWRLAYRGIIPQAHLEQMISRRTARWWTNTMRSRESVKVLTVTGEVVGYSTYGLSRTRGRVGKAEGEIYELYLSPLHQGMGLGEHLFEGTRHTLEMRGLGGLIVWALTDNQSAVDFYWRRGGRPIIETTELIGGARLKKIAFEWT